jgi:hypothetical protein
MASKNFCDVCGEEYEPKIGQPYLINHNSWDLCAEHELKLEKVLIEWKKKKL